MAWTFLLVFISSFILYGECKNSRKVVSSCKHGGYLKDVNFEDGEKSNNYTLIGSFKSMKGCVEKCCHTKHCDLAMLKKDNKCYSVNCNQEESCHIIHMKASSKDGAEIAFITKPSSDAVVTDTKKKRKEIHKKRKRKKKKKRKNEKISNMGLNNAKQNENQTDAHQSNKNANKGMDYIFVDEENYALSKDDQKKDPTNYDITKVKKINKKVLSNNNKTVTESSKTVKTNKMKKLDKGISGNEKYAGNFEIKTETHSKTTNPDHDSYHYSTSYQYDSKDGENQASFKQNNYNSLPGGFQYPGSYMDNSIYHGAQQIIPPIGPFDHEGEFSNYEPYQYASKSVQNDIKTNEWAKEKTIDSIEVGGKSKTNRRLQPSKNKTELVFSSSNSTEKSTPTNASLKRPTNDGFLSEISADLNSNGKKISVEDEAEDMSSGADVKIAEDGTLVAAVKNKTYPYYNTISLLNSTKYQPIEHKKLTRYEYIANKNTTTADVNHYDKPEPPSKYFDKTIKNATMSSISNNTFGTYAWKQESYMYNYTTDSNGKMRSAFGDVGDVEMAPAQQQNKMLSMDADAASLYNQTTHGYDGKLSFVQQQSSFNNTETATDELMPNSKNSNYHEANIAMTEHNKSNLTGSPAYVYNVMNPTRDMNVGQIQKELIGSDSDIGKESGNIYSWNYNATGSDVNQEARNSVANNFSTFTQPVPTNANEQIFRASGYLSDNSAAYSNNKSTPKTLSNSKNNTDNKRPTETVGNSLFPKVKKNNSYVEVIQEELASGSGDEKVLENFEEEEKKEEKITKSIQSSYDAFGNDSKHKLSMPKDTEVFLIAEELESGSGSGSADRTNEEDDYSEPINTALEDNAKPDLKSSSYDEESEDNVSDSLYSTPIYEFKSTTGANVVKKLRQNSTKNALQDDFSNLSSKKRTSHLLLNNVYAFQNGTNLTDRTVSNIQSKERQEEYSSGNEENYDSDKNIESTNTANQQSKNGSLSIPDQTNYFSYRYLATPQPVYSQLNKSHQSKVNRSSFVDNFKRKASRWPTIRPEQVIKPLRGWPTKFTEKNTNMVLMKKKGLLQNDNSNLHHSRFPEKFQSTRRSTISKKRPTTVFNSTTDLTPTEKHAKVPAAKAVEYDRKPPKKSFLPDTDQAEIPNIFDDNNKDEDWLQQSLLDKNVLEPQSTNNYFTNEQQHEPDFIDVKNHRRKYHHKHKHRILTLNSNAGESATLIPIGRLPAIAKKHHKISKKLNDRFKGNHVMSNSVMINTGIKANSLLGQMLTGDATPDITGESPNPELASFATQMALSNTHLGHKKHEYKFPLDQTDTESNRLPSENNLAFPYKEQQQTNGIYLGTSELQQKEHSDLNNLYSDTSDLPFKTEGSPSSPFSGLNEVLPHMQRKDKNREFQDQSTLALGQKGTRYSHDVYNAINSGDAMGNFQPHEFESNSLQEDLKISPNYRPYHPAYHPGVTNGRQNAATLNVLNNLNGHDKTEADRLANRFNNDLSGLSDEISKIPGIAQITGIQSGSAPGESPEIFSQRHNVANGESGAEGYRNVPSYASKFDTFTSFQNFSPEKQAWLDLNRNHHEQKPMSSPGKKKDKLFNPENLTEKYVKDDKQKTALLSATKFFIHEPSEGKYSWNNAPEVPLKINITDNPDENTGSLLDVAVDKNSTLQSTPIEVYINNDQNGNAAASRNQTEELEILNKTFSGNNKTEKSSFSTLYQNHEINLHHNDTKGNLSSKSPVTSSRLNTFPDASSTYLENDVKLEENGQQNMTKNSSTHIPWRSKTGKGIKPANKEDQHKNSDSSASEIKDKYLSRKYDNGSNSDRWKTHRKTKKKKVNKFPESDRFSSLSNKTKSTPEDEANWKEVVMETQYALSKDMLHPNIYENHYKKNNEYISNVSSNQYNLISLPRQSNALPKLFHNHVLRKLSQELQKSSKSKQTLPNHKFFHALKEALVSKLHSLNNHGDVMLDRDEPSSLLASIYSKDLANSKRIFKKKHQTKKKRIRQEKIHKEYETKQSKIVKDDPNKGASLLDVEATRQKKLKKKAQRKISGNKYREKPRNKKSQRFNTAIAYSVPLQHKATHKKEKENKEIKKPLEYNRLHHYKPHNRYIPSEEVQFNGEYGIDFTDQTHLSQRHDSNHGHPMMGHRFGDANYQSTHKWANHDYSKQLGHYGMHNDTTDNHDNSDIWADKEPGKNMSKQQNKQQATVLHLPNLQHDVVPQEMELQQREELGVQQFPSQHESHGMEKEKEITAKLNTFNILANSLTSKLNDLKAANGMKAITGADWNTFINYQRNLDGIKQARQKVINHFQNQDGKCNRGLTVRGATLRGGVLSGEFKSMGVVDTQKECVEQCCNSQHGCDAAMTIGRECINIKCFNKKQCTIAPAGDLKIYNRVLPVVTFIRKPKKISKRAELYRPDPLNIDLTDLDENEREEINTIVRNGPFV